MLIALSLAPGTFMGVTSFWGGYVFAVLRDYLLRVENPANFYGTKQHIFGIGHGQKANVILGHSNRLGGKEGVGYDNDRV